MLTQLAAVRDLVNQSLDVVDVSTWTGDPLDANFISGQLRLLYENIAEARSTLKGDAVTSRGQWWESSADDNVCELFHMGIAYVEVAYADTLQKVFDPPLPPYVSFHLAIADAALVLHLRTLEPNATSLMPTAFAPDISLTGFSLRERLFGPRHRPHDEAGDIFIWRGEEVKVKEKIRIDSQDPSLIAVMAKLTALEHEVMKCMASLKVVMGDDDAE